MMPTEPLTNSEWLPGELLSGSECSKPGWFLDMKCQTCFSKAVMQNLVRNFLPAGYAKVHGQLIFMGQDILYSGVALGGTMGVGC